MHQNTFSTTPDTKKYLFQGHVSGGLKACEIALKHGSNHARRKNFFFFWWSGSMRKCIKTRF
jgi:surfactin synthase thioesterase subunit